MQKHLEFQIVTPRTLADFHGKTLVLPDVRVLDETEQNWMKDFVTAGKKLVITGTDVTELGDAKNVVRILQNPGKAYNTQVEKDFQSASPESQKEFFSSLEGGDTVRIEASSQMATSISRTSDGHINCFFANFAGLKAGSNPIQTPQNGVKVTLAAKSSTKGFFLPFMGQVQPLQGAQNGDAVTFTLPTISRGAVFWVEP
jgi:hypothetical protein